MPWWCDPISLWPRDRIQILPGDGVARAREECIQRSLPVNMPGLFQVLVDEIGHQVAEGGLVETVSMASTFQHFQVYLIPGFS